MTNKRTSTILFLESFGSVAVIPWFDGAPDFTGIGITDPALTMLQQAWQQFVDSSQLLEIIPDSEIIRETAAPDWDSFYNQLLLSEIYNFLLSQTIPHPSISGVMAVMGFAIKDGQSDPSNPDRLEAFQASVSGVIAALNIVGIPLSDQQLTEIRSLLDGNGFEMIQLE